MRIIVTCPKCGHRWRVERGREEMRTYRRRGWCIVCGERFERKLGGGRRRRFCSTVCRQKNYREEKKWTKKAVDAALAGKPEPPKDWLWKYRAGDRPGGNRNETRGGDNT